MARALQTLVISRQGLAEPAFSSIEEWLGSNTTDYYRVLAFTGAGRWQPERDATTWVEFNLRAHHMQAQTLRRRFHEAVRAPGCSGSARTPSPPYPDLRATLLRATGAAAT
jgi:Fic family protein